MTTTTSVFPSLSIRKSVLLGMGLALACVFIASLAVGSVNIPLDNVLRVLAGGHADKDTWETIILAFRLPKALTALLAGAALGVAGLQMQTLFRNPLADPFVLGVSSGASLGVALVVLGTGATSAAIFGRSTALGDVGVVAAASIGAAAVFAVIMAVARRVQSVVTLLVLGLMIGYATNAAVSLLIYFSAPAQIATFTAWSFGSFGGVTWQQLHVLIPVSGLTLAAAFAFGKPLNALMLGENYARSMGLNVRLARWWITGTASVLAGAVTAFCGPIGFIGVAVPHLCRALFRSSDHRVLMPAVTLTGALLALLFDLIAQMPGAQFTLPLNVVTSFVGAPLIVWIIIRRRSFAHV